MKKKNKKILIVSSIIFGVLLIGFIAFQNKNLFGFSLFSQTFPIGAGYNWGKGLPAEMVYKACRLEAGDNYARLVPSPECPIIFQIGKTLSISSAVSNYQSCDKTINVLNYYKWQSLATEPPPCVWNANSPPPNYPNDEYVTTFATDDGNRMEAQLKFLENNAFTINYDVVDRPFGNEDKVILKINNNFKEDINVEEGHLIMVFWISRMGLWGKEEVFDLSPEKGLTSLKKGENIVEIDLPIELPEGRYKADAFLGYYTVTWYTLASGRGGDNFGFSMVPLTSIIEDNFNVLFSSTETTSTTTVPTNNFCAEDIQQCSDGSYVTRDPNNNCEFRLCETEKPKDYTSIIIILSVIIIFSILIYFFGIRKRR